MFVIVMFRPDADPDSTSFHITKTPGSGYATLVVSIIRLIYALGFIGNRYINRQTNILQYN